MVKELFSDEDKSYPIELVAEFLGVNSRTLYYYEKFSLVCPLRRGRKRYYSKMDIRWLVYVRELMYEQGMNLRSIIILIRRRDNVVLDKCPEDVVDSFMNYLMQASSGEEE
ncbi:MAG: MerR family transcriptional regulator [Actinobacteria bacterium]|nr:MerR family transcriptional regulator [Actinomycetota bacterium]MBL7060543.1 MerR family transcriptional regulator [Actinomycetota bacterium]